MAEEKIFDYHPASVVPLNLIDGEPPVAIDVLYRILTSTKDFGTVYTLETIPLHLATDQFIAYMATLEAFNMDIASDFITMGTTLLKIKAQALLVVPVDDVEQEDDRDLMSEEILRRKLLVYEIVKKNREKLAEREKLYRINRKPKYTDADAIIVIDNFDINKLIDAYGVVLFRIGEKEVSQQIKKIPKDKYPVKAQVKKIVNIISQKKKAGFYSLFEGEINRSEGISTFQALLALMSKQIVFAEQNGNEEIQVEFNPEYEGKEIDYASLNIDEEDDVETSEDDKDGKLG